MDSLPQLFVRGLRVVQHLQQIALDLLPPHEPIVLLTVHITRPGIERDKMALDRARYRDVRNA